MTSRKVKDMNQQHTSEVTPAEQQHRRDKRRLPHVQRCGRSRPLTFWPTRRGAAEWLRRNRGTLDTALGLLEIYPTLIQERSMDVLWEFVSPFIALAQNRDSFRNGRGHRSTSSTASRSGTGTASRSSGTHRTTTTSCSSQASNGVDRASTDNGDIYSNNQTSQEHLPLISITYPHDEPEPELQALFEDEDSSLAGRPPCVYVCCLCNYPFGNDGCDRPLRQNVIHALQHEFYVRSGPCGSDTHGLDKDDLTEVGVCVFVLDESSLNTPACLNHLYASWTLNIRTVFVKDGNYCLPSPLPDAILQHITALESLDMLPVSSATSLPISRSATPKCGLNIPASRTSSTSSKKHESKQDVQDSDIILYLLNGYRTALIFEEAKLDDCENMLRETVHSLLDPSQNDSSSSSSASSYSSLCSFSDGSGSVQHRNQNSLMASSAQIDGFGWNSSGEASGSVSSVSNNNNYPSTNHLLPIPYFQNALTNRLRSPPPTKRTLSSSKSSLPSVKSSSKRRHLSASSSHLPQVQQQARARFHLGATTANDSENVEEKTERQQTTYLLFNKPRHSPDKEPCVVTWPPPRGEKKKQDRQEEDTLSETFTDSPVSLKNFKDLDLSAEVNNHPLDLDTPDSDSPFSSE